MRMSRRISTFAGEHVLTPSHGVLPDEYYQLQWCELDGKQYISLGSVLGTYGCRAMYLKPNAVSGNYYLLSNGTPGISNGYVLVIRSSSSFSAKANLVYRSNEELTTEISESGSSQEFVNLYVINAPWKQSVALNGTTLSSRTPSGLGMPYSGAYRLTYVFGGDNGGTDSFGRPYQGRCGELRIYRYSWSGTSPTTGSYTLAYRLYPAYRISDGKVGFYDYVNSVFRVSDGSADFGAGDFIYE